MKRSPIGRFLGAPVEPEPLYLRCCPTLSWEDRVLGFVGCFVIGIAISLSSFLSWGALVNGHPGLFAVKYSAGNVLSLFSTAFLVGPREQLRKMVSPVRVVTTSVYLGSIAATLIAATLLQEPTLTVVAMVVQFLALLWYCLSYIPFGRKMIGRLFSARARPLL